MPRLPLALAALAVLAVAPALAQDGPAAADGRRPLTVSAAARTTVLAEMRGMLASVAGALDGIARGDGAAVAEAARASGMQHMNPAARQLMMTLPEDFRMLGRQVHLGFDGLAEAAQAGAPAKELTARLGAVTSVCVGCHAGFRLVVGE